MRLDIEFLNVSSIPYKAAKAKALIKSVFTVEPRLKEEAGKLTFTVGFAQSAQEALNRINEKLTTGVTAHIESQQTRAATIQICGL